MASHRPNLADSLAEIASLLNRVTHLQHRLAPDDLPIERGSEPPLEATVRQFLPVLRELYLEPLAVSMQALVLALARNDESTDQALDLLRRLMRRGVDGARHQHPQSANGGPRAKLKKGESDGVL